MRPITSDYLETLSAVQLLQGLTQEFTHAQATLADFVRFVRLNLSTKRVIADESWFMSGDKAVELLTVYKAKGLEFDNVFVVDGVETMWRPRSGGRISPANLQLQSYGEKYDDYIRLLYVAASRARRTLIATSYFTDDQGNEILPTPLLAALPLEKVNKPTDEPLPVLESALRWPALSSQDQAALLHDRLEQFSLSPTALIDFLNVAEAGPHSFLERHLLRLPTERSAVGSYGTAIHASLETAQRLVNTSQLRLASVLDRFETTLQEEHLAPADYEHFRIRGQTLLKNLLQKDNLLLPKGGLAEQKINDITLDKARIKGKLDRLNLNDGQLIISDYKTGKALASFTTKDRTKAVKAWRHKTQLLFYCLLAQKDARFAKAKDITAQMLYLEAEQPEQRALTLKPDISDIARLESLIEAVWQHVTKLEFPNTENYPANAEGIQAFEDDLINGKI